MLWTTVRFPRAGLVPSKKGCQIFETDGTRAPGAAEKYGTGFLWRWDSPEKRPEGVRGGGVPEQYRAFSSIKGSGTTDGTHDLVRGSLENPGLRTAGRAQDGA